MTPIHALVFKNLSKSVVMLDILKSQCKFITLWGSTCSKKRVAGPGRSILRNLGSQGPGCVSPGGSLREAPSSHFFYVVLRLTRL